MSLIKGGINVTTKAWKKMAIILTQSKNPYGFLFSSSSGGCSGFNFTLDLLDTQTYEDISSNKFLTVLEHTCTLDQEGTHKLYIDPLSEMFLLGTTIDYVTEDYSKGQFENKFTFEVDKDLLSTCGCGISFTPKVR